MARGLQTKVWAVKCPRCGDSIYSRCQQDSRTCSCGDTNIAGPNELLRVGYKVTAPFRYELTVDTTQQQLFLDWRSRANKFGHVRAVEPEVTVVTLPPKNEPKKESASTKPVELPKPKAAPKPPASPPVITTNETGTTSPANQDSKVPSRTRRPRRRRRTVSTSESKD